MALDQTEAKIIRANIAQAIQELPALPVVVSKIMQEIQNENVSATALEKLIGSDPAIAAKTLRVVNSAYYGMSRQIASLSQAVVILGVQQLRNLVLSLSTMSLLKPQSNAAKRAHNAYWMHSIASASAALTLARKKQLPSAELEVAFVAGLLHDIGRLFLFTNFTELYIEIDEACTEGESLEELEISRIGLNHGQVGQVLAQVWQFPESVAQIMGTHTGPFDSNTDTLSLTIHVSHLLANDIVFGWKSLENADPVALAWLNEFDEELFQIRNEVEAKVYSYEMLYGLLAA